jgi:type II secretory pathway component PulK
MRRLPDIITEAFTAALLRAGSAVASFKRNYEFRKTALAEKGLRGYVFNSSGYVLIIVLLVTSLLVSVSSEFLLTAQTNINYIRKFNDRTKAWSLAHAGIDLSAFILEADMKGLAGSVLPGLNSNKAIDCYRDLWAVDFPDLPMEDGTVKIRISDEQAKINLSVLANEVVDKTPYYSVAQRLLLNMGLPMDLADTLIDWVDIDDSRFPQGAESSDYYFTLPSPYKAKNAEMESIQEMLMVKDVTPEIYYGLGSEASSRETNLVDDNRGKVDLDTSQISKYLPGAEGKVSEGGLFMKDVEVKVGKEKSRRLSDYFRVNGERSDYLSELNKININTASYRVISALTDLMTDDVVTELLLKRQAQPFNSVEEVKDMVTDETIRRNILTVKSSLFRINCTGSVGSTSITITAVYNRETKKFLYIGEQ